MKKATTTQQQLQKLSDRGMLIDCEDKATEHLLDIGYYRLGFYWKYFEKDKNHYLITIHCNNTHSLDTSIKVILHFLGVVSEKRKNDLEKNINELFIKNAKNKDIKKL